MIYLSMKMILKKMTMSRLFEKFVEEVFVGNHHLFDEAQRHQVEINEQEMTLVHQEWVDGIRTPETHSVNEWEFFGKPLFKNRHNQSRCDDSLNHIFGNPVEELEQLINQTFKK